MIVACPSCRQRFRHSVASPVAPATARCSACDERFPLLLPRASYRILGQEGSATVPVGSRVPLVAPGPAVVPPRTATAPRPVAIELPIHAPVPIPTRLEGEVGEEPLAPAPAESATRRRGPAPARALGEAVVAFTPCAAGAGLAYHFAGTLGQEPVTAATMGAAVGLLLGWACLLWITRGS
jgi:hypothetical protein